MFNQRWFRALGISIPVITGVLLLGFLQAIFGVEVSTNLFNTGITPGMIFGVLQLLLAFWVYKKFI